MTSARTDSIKKNIDQVLDEARKRKYFGDAWEKFKVVQYGVDFSYDRSEKSFKRETGQSIFHFFHLKLYEMIITMILLNEIESPKSKRHTLLGIKQFGTKVERFFSNDFDHVLNGIKEKNRLLEETKDIRSQLDEFNFIEEYEICSDGTVHMKFSDEAALSMIYLYRPIMVSKELNDQSLALLDNPDRKKLELLAIEHAIKDGLDKIVQDNYAFSMSEDELEVGFMRLDTYNLSSPREIGDTVYYLHEYSDLEKRFISDALSRNYDNFITLFTIYRPNDATIDYVEEFISYFWGRSACNLKKLAKKTGKSKEYLIDLIVKMITNGFLFIDHMEKAS